MYLQEIIYAVITLICPTNCNTIMKFKCSGFICDEQMLSMVCSGEVNSQLLYDIRKQETQ